ncbi:unnamed protein product [Rodentolepis nana]|uniref:Cytochrome-b5 reductase n=1 Tax=Rodentolepis nana TaxID=102285 RepID=A0A0R3T651_RODNA|nr:unnamed protein product [Rodentolepis nana]
MARSEDLAWIIPISITAGIAALALAGGLIVKFVFKKSPHKYLQGKSIKLPLRLVDKEVLTHDTNLYTFGFPNQDTILGLPVGGCVQLHARINGEDVKRPYTPVTLDDFKGYVKFVIKTYRKDVNPKFPAGGKMSQYLETLSVGDGIDVSGPFGLIHYLGDGDFDIKGANLRKLKANNINMICGGSGLTPIYQILKHILNSTTDKTKIALVFANETEKDIILRDELEQLRDANQTQFRLWYTLTSPPENWSYSAGYIDQGMIDKHCYPAGENTVNLLCGPPTMIDNACIPALKSSGHTDANILTF